MENSNQFYQDDLLLNLQIDYDQFGVASWKKNVMVKVIGYTAKGELDVDIISGFRYAEKLKGDRFVKVGNLSNPKRQGGIIIDTITVNNPRFIIYNGMDSVNKLLDPSTFKFLAGNLSEIQDTDFQPLGAHYMTVDGTKTGDPLWGAYGDDSVYLKGKIHTKEGGKVGGFSVIKDGAEWHLISGTGDTRVGLSDGEYSFYAGNNTPADSKAWIKNIGEAYFNNVIIDDGSYVKTTTLRDIENIPFIQGLTFSLKPDKSIQWSSGTIVHKGITKVFVSGSTTVDKKYITWKVGDSTFVTHSTIPTLDAETFLLAYRNSSDLLVASSFSQIIYADLIQVNTLSAITADLGTINAGIINGIEINGSTINGGVFTTIYNEAYTDVRIRIEDADIIFESQETNLISKIHFNASSTDSIWEFYSDGNMYIQTDKHLGFGAKDYISFEISGAGEVFRLKTVGFGVGMEFGGDTNLYRPSSNLLKTDDSFTVGLNFRIGRSQSVNSINTSITAGSLNTELPTALAVYSLVQSKQPSAVLLNQSVSIASINVAGYSAVELVYAAVVGLENLTGANDGQIVSLFNSGSSSFVLNENANLRLAGSFTFGQYDVLVLQYINSTIKWIEISRSNN